MAIRARLYKDRKRVAGDGMAIYGSAAIISRTGQVTVDAVNIRLDMGGMGIIPGLLLVTTGTKSVGGYGGVSFLRVYFVAINAGDLHLTMPARLPLRQSAGVAVATQVRRSCNDHAFFRPAQIGQCWYCSRWCGRQNTRQAVPPVAGKPGKWGQTRLEHEWC